MNKLIINILMVLFLLLEQTAFASQEAQELCQQQFVTNCMDQCQKTNDINCTQACQENAINQCREAGE